MSGILARSCGIAMVLLGLAACTSVDSSMGIEPTASTEVTAPETAEAETTQPEEENAPVETVEAPVPATPAKPSVPLEAAAVTVDPGNGAESDSSTVRVAFAPIVGAPVDRVSALAARLGPAARANGITVASETAPDLTHRIKGYLSAFTDDGRTIVIHVWDIIGPDGNRIHRLQGQQSVDAASDDPWQSVPDSTMQAIADALMADYAAWQRERG